MLSKAEIEFLKNPEKFDTDYRYVLRHRVKVKSAQMCEHAIMLQGVGLNLTENCKNLTNFCNVQSELKLSFKHEKVGKCWCSGRDSDPGLRLERPEYLTGLYYRSVFG